MNILMSPPVAATLNPSGVAATETPPLVVVLNRPCVPLFEPDVQA